MRLNIKSLPNGTVDFQVKVQLKNQLIIGLAYAPDGAKPQQYQVVSFATLNCKNDQLVLSKPIVPFFSLE